MNEVPKLAETLSRAIRFAVFNPTVQDQSIAFAEEKNVDMDIQPLPIISISPADSRKYVFDESDIDAITAQQALFLTDKEFAELKKALNFGDGIKDCFFFIKESREIKGQTSKTVIQVSPVIMNEGFFPSQELAICAAMRVQQVIETIFENPENNDEKSNYYKLMVEPDIYPATGPEAAMKLFTDIITVAEADALTYALSQNKINEYLQAYKSIVPTDNKPSSVTVTNPVHWAALRLLAREYRLSLPNYFDLVKNCRISLPLLKTKYDKYGVTPPHLPHLDLDALKH